METGEVQLMLY